MDLLLMWILYAVLGAVLFAVAFLWAVRTGQFRDQDRARRLPLEHPPQPEDRGRLSESER